MLRNLGLLKLEFNLNLFMCFLKLEANLDGRSG